jgi:cation diffusion facilitator CzcD-associated flavoprotein CzcO
MTQAPRRVEEVGVLEVVVIGAGQAGLSVAYHLRRAGLSDFLVLDDAAGPGGSWPHRWDGLTLGLADDIHDLPGMEIIDPKPDEPVNLVMPRYFAAYEYEFEIPVRRPVRVRSVRRAEPAEAEGADGAFVVESDSGSWVTRAVVSATGTWQRPFWPSYPGRAEFAGRQLHSKDYRSADEFAGEHVIVIGGGTSAVHLLLELAHVASTTWVTRRAPVFAAPDLDDEARRMAMTRAEDRIRAGLPPESAVSVTGLPLTEAYRRGMDSGVLYRLPMFSQVVSDGVVWSPELVPPAPEFLSADVLLWATGYRAALEHLAPLRLRTREGGIVVDGAEVVVEPHVQLVGYGPYATTVGANRSSRMAVRNLRRVLGF